MESYNSLKNRFKEQRDIGDGFYSQRKYSQALGAYKNAALLLQELYQRAPNEHDKSLFSELLGSVKARYLDCQNKIAEAGENGEAESPAPRAATVPVSPSPAPSRGSSKPAKGKPSSDSFDIDNLTAATKNGKKPNFEFVYGDSKIDVRSFLGEASNLKVKFDDVVGMERAKRIARTEFFPSDAERILREAINQQPKNFILLYGLPGTGKTYFAIALSNELRDYYGDAVPFISILGSLLKSSKPGMVERNLKAVFAFAEQFKRCVIFFDEFDSIAMSRQIDTGDPTDRASTTTFIQLLGGFNTNPNLLILAATNTPYDIDGAILSRATLKFEVPLPSAEVLKGVLQRKIGSRLDPSVNIDELAQTLADKKYSNRDCSSLINGIYDVFVAYNSEKYDAAFLKDANNLSQLLINQEIIDRAIKLHPASYVAAEDKKLIKFTNENAN